MTLTFADIERWDAGSVREVFHAATGRAQAAADAANGLATLPAFETWGGVAAEAAREAIGKTRRDLDAHGREAQAVANAARNAADEIEHIKSELASVKADAESLGMEIDPMTGEVLPGRTIRDPMEALLKEEQLQPRVNKIIAEANMVDIALANAIHMADGSTPIPGSGSGSDVGAEIPVGKNTEEVKQWWQSLSEEKRQQLLEDWPDKLGPLDGIPVADRVEANAAEVAASRGMTKEEVLAHPERYGIAGPMMNRYNNGLKAKQALGPDAPDAIATPGDQPANLSGALDQLAGAPVPAEATPPVIPAKDIEAFKAAARPVLAADGVPPEQIESRLSQIVGRAQTEGINPFYRPPEPGRLPAPGFGEGFGDAWRNSEQSLKNLLGQGGPGAPGVVDSWKEVAKGVNEVMTNPVGTAVGQVQDALHSPSAAYYAGQKTFDLAAAAATAPFGGEGAAARAALPTDIATAAGETGLRAPALDGLVDVGTHPPVTAANPLFHDAASLFGGDHHVPGDVDAPVSHDLSDLMVPIFDTGPYPLPDSAQLQTAAHEAHFWSGRGLDGAGVGPLIAGGNGSADLIAATSNGTTLEGLLQRQGIKPPVWTPGDVYAQNWWSAVSQSFAQNSSGELTSVLGSNLRPGNVWETVELPRLMDNPNVTKITVINSDTGVATIVFQR